MKQEDIVCRCLTCLTPLFQMLHYKITNTLYSRCKLSSSYSPGLYNCVCLELSLTLFSKILHIINPIGMRFT